MVAKRVEVPFRKNEKLDLVLLEIRCKYVIYRILCSFFRSLENYFFDPFQTSFRLIVYHLVLA